MPFNFVFTGQNDDDIIAVWKEMFTLSARCIDDKTCVGLGQRMFATITGEFSLPDTLHIDLKSSV